MFMDIFYTCHNWIVFIRDLKISHGFKANLDELWCMYPFRQFITSMFIVYFVLIIYSIRIPSVKQSKYSINKATHKSHTIKLIYVDYVLYGIVKYSKKNFERRLSEEINSIWEYIHVWILLYQIFDLAMNVFDYTCFYLVSCTHKKQYIYAK